MNVKQKLSHSKNRIRRWLRDPLNPSNQFDLTLDGIRKAHNKIKSQAGVEEQVRRQTLVKQLEEMYDGPYIEEDQGFMVSSLDRHPSFEEYKTLCRNKYPISRLQELSKPSKKDTLLSAHIDLDNPEHKPFKDLALSTELLAPIGRYLGTMPILYGAYIWYSKNHQNHDLVGSQFYHHDREDIRQIKVFVPLEDITEDCGPLNVMPAKQSLEFVQYRAASKGGISTKQHFDDEEVHRICGMNGIPLTGDVGIGAFVDTTSCLHYGSRPSNKYKYHGVFHYVSSYCPKLYRTLNLSEAGNSVEEMVLQRVRNIDDPLVI